MSSCTMMLSTIDQVKPGGLDLGLSLGDFVGRPGAAIIEMVKRGDDADRPRLLDMRKLHRIVRAEPTPRLFHAVFLCRASSAARDAACAYRVEMPGRPLYQCRCVGPSGGEAGGIENALHGFLRGWLR